MSTEKINFIEEDEIVESDSNRAQILNTFFCNIVSNLKRAEYATQCQMASTIQLLNPSKYRKQPSLLKIGGVCNRNQCSLFPFLHVDKEEILKEI